jgi:hypothetical protein
MPTQLPWWIEDAALAGWVQAIGTILAIGGGLLAASWQHRLEARAAQRRIKEEAYVSMSKLRELLHFAWRNVSALVDDPDSPHRLEQHWREDSNGDVRVQLELIEVSLSQFRSIPLADIPLGGSVLMSINDVVYTLAVAKSALSREISSKPISKDAMHRISDAIFIPKNKLAKSVIRTLAQLRAMLGESFDANTRPESTKGDI